MDKYLWGVHNTKQHCVAPVQYDGGKNGDDDGANGKKDGDVNDGGDDVEGRKNGGVQV